MKLLKFDTLYPADYINSKIRDNFSEIQKMSYEEFHKWVISLRMNFSDFYSYNLSVHGWDAKEIFLGNRVYLDKCGNRYFGGLFFLYKLFYKIMNKYFLKNISLNERLLKKIIKIEKPDVIYVREQSTIRSKFWEQFKDNCLLVSRMDCGIPKDWSPLSFDLIYTNINSYKDFFEANNIKTLSNSNGFDKRITDEIQFSTKIYDITFIGGLGDYYGFVDRTNFYEKLLAELGNQIKFYWWGYKTGDFDKKYPLLAKSHRGQAGGREMFEIYAQSKIVMNDYGVAANGKAVNQRIFEVLGVGSFLLTRYSESLIDWKDFLDTYNNVEECVEKINFYINNDLVREDIASKGQEWVLKKYNYRGLLGQISDELISHYNSKFKIQ
ncbi:MAG: hypothetical protein CVV23_08495 [Ignavibacteriae bacterium HGW-Ignavibacteriae-2]|jgi:hypothetical protein|nr:glycosyltransferase [Bacteroidota bacterium]PKL88779.1 MAG: hypothetical protein CVV23_08495 [Ignavibacteriae bacterium HGW-Ignavibacteriae-2]